MIQASLPTASKSMCGCADFNDENNLLWTIDRGLLGTLPASHNPSSLPLALTPIAGCSFGTATLTADLGVGDESMNVSAGNWLPPIPTPDSPPTFPQMKIQIDQEILGVMEVSSANSGTTWVVQRGLNGTTPAEHTDSSAAVRLARHCRDRRSGANRSAVGLDYVGCCCRSIRLNDFPSVSLWKRHDLHGRRFSAES